MTKVRLTKWRRRLSKAIKEGGFTFKDRSKAQTWTCCAVGERDKKCKGLITDELTTHDNAFISSNFRIDTYSLGMEFASAINRDDFVKALEVIEQIEKIRSKGVLQMKEGIYKIANSTSELKNNVVEAFLNGVIPYEDIIWWSKKF